MRIGIGYDVHRLVPNRKLIIGGVQIPYEKGLDGHSDADVLIHAIMDSILGAMGEGDIGSHFPDNDEKYKDISSVELLKKVCSLVKLKKFEIENIDAVVIAQKPKIFSYIEKMEIIIADTLNTDKKNVNIKATTTEKLGFEGREEGMSCQAVCLLR